MNTYQINAATIDDIAIALRKAGFIAYAEDASLLLTDASGYQLDEIIEWHEVRGYPYTRQAGETCTS